MVTPQDGVPSLAGADYFAELDETLLCPIAAASWHSDALCAQNEDGQCEVAIDGGYWEALGQPADVPTEAPTDVPAPAVTVVTRIVQALPPPAPPAQIVYRQAEAPTPEVITVVSTVLVYVPTSTPAPTLTPSVTATLTPTWTPLPTLESVAAPLATPQAQTSTSQPAGDSLGIWGVVLGGLAVLALM